MAKQSDNKNKSKKEVVLKGNNRRMNPMTIVIGFAVLLVAFGVAFFITDTGQISTQSASTAEAGASEVQYPVSLFADGQARHFSHKANGMTIRYFILKSADGVIRAAFDACDVCWPAGKGYYQDDDDMVCRNCGRRFASARVNEVKGGCNPAPLNRRVANDQLVIKVDDILTGQSYFNLKGV